MRACVKFCLLSMLLSFVVVVSAPAQENFQQVFNKGHKALNAKKYDEAKKYFDEALAMAKTPGEKGHAHLYLGHWNSGQKNYDKAREHFMTVTKLDGARGSDVSGAMFSLSGIAYSQGDKDKAIEIANKIMDLPKGNDNHKALAAQKIAVIRLQRKNPDAAIEALEKALTFGKAKADTKARILELLVDQLYKQKKYDEALAVIEPKLKLPGVKGPFMSGVRLTAARCYAELGRTEEALAAYEAVTTMPDARSSDVKKAKNEMAKLKKN